LVCREVVVSLLATLVCTACRGDEPPLSRAQIDEYGVQVPEWGRVTVRWWTHKIRGLHRNDFIMAGKSDGVYAEMKRERT
jgi:hypothetical protein